MTPVTKAELAAELGVSCSTIDLARGLRYNNRSSIAPATRARVLEAVERRGYDPVAAMARGGVPTPRGDYRSVGFGALRARWPDHATDGEIAQDCGVARETIVRSRARGRIPWFTAERIADNLGVHPAEIWGDDYWAIWEEESNP
jgi:DNA-binding XRE family transcriptional regulator